MNRRSGQVDLDSPGREQRGTELQIVVLAIAVLALIVFGQLSASPDGLRAGSQPVGGTPVDVPRNAHLPAPPSVSVSRPELVLNTDGSATLSASLATTGKEVALMSVQIMHQGSVQEVSSTDMWLPVTPGIDATVGAASDAGGFTVPRGLNVGDVADVYFIFDDQTCISVEAEVVQRTARHKSVFPKRGSQLGPALGSPNSLTSTCSDPTKTAGLA